MAETEPQILPTGSRAKHSQAVSYPIGAEALSQALNGVPQYDQITCDFYGGGQHDHGKPQLYVLSVHYRKQAQRFSYSRSAIDHGAFDPQWKITVFAVPRQLRGAIKLLLLEQGLPDLVRQWLIEKSHLTGQTGESVLWLEYVRADQVFITTTREQISPARSC